MANANSIRLSNANYYRKRLRALTARICRWCNNEYEILEKENRSGEYYAHAREVLVAYSHIWAELAEHLEIYSNGKFKTNASHTWGQLGDNGHIIMQIYRLMDEYKACTLKDKSDIEMTIDFGLLHLIL